MQAHRLAATDLACRRGDRILFSGLSLSLESGQALHVRGANGTGKTSLIRLLAGLARPFAGTVERDGSIALLDDQLALDEMLPVGRALQFWERLDGCSDPSQPMAAMALEDLLDVPVRYLSSGQRKRVAFARILLRRHDIWLLDEPLNALDDESRAKVEGLIALHCGGGGICVVASHQSIALPDPQTIVLDEA